MQHTQTLGVRGTRPLRRPCPYLPFRCWDPDFRHLACAIRHPMPYLPLAQSERWLPERLLHELGITGGAREAGTVRGLHARSELRVERRGGCRCSPSHSISALLPADSRWGGLEGKGIKTGLAALGAGEELMGTFDSDRGSSTSTEETSGPVHSLFVMRNWLWLHCRASARQL